jgi:ABC-type Fe3+-hydroxamate transport system substrate-binding protein
MKRLLLIISALALVLLLIGCAGNVIQSTIESALAGLRATYTIEVTDTEGFNFTGRYVVVTAAYDPVNYVALDSTSYDVVSENVSKEYTVTDAISIGAMFQKLSANGTLTVRILKGGVEVDSDSTTEPSGAVLVTAVTE